MLSDAQNPGCQPCSEGVLAKPKSLPGRYGRGSDRHHNSDTKVSGTSTVIPNKLTCTRPLVPEFGEYDASE